MVCDLLLVDFDPFCVFRCFRVRCLCSLWLTAVKNAIMKAAFELQSSCISEKRSDVRFSSVLQFWITFPNTAWLKLKAQLYKMCNCPQSPFRVCLSTDGFNADSADHHTLLLFLMMTASDLSDQTKNWEGTRRTAVDVWFCFLLKYQK